MQQEDRKILNWVMNRVSAAGILTWEGRALLLLQVVPLQLLPGPGVLADKARVWWRKLLPLHSCQHCSPVHFNPSVHAVLASPALLVSPPVGKAPRIQLIQHDP